jgi:hypothetical protein
METRRSEFDPAKLHYLWSDAHCRRSFQTGVSLHSHTLHSREYLDFIPRLCDRSATLRQLVGIWHAGYVRRYGHPADYSRAWWTPPVCARQALDLESRQIEDGLDLAPLVSITDHDSIDAARMLSMTSAAGSVVWSVEWTLPYAGTSLHIGVHNMPQCDAEARFAAVARYTDCPNETRLRELLEWLARPEGSLLVVNHPFWDESGIDMDAHTKAVHEFLLRYGRLVHALELNGLRSWTENRQVLALAAACRIPAVSGGDRHGTEPNAIVNLTNARTFDEFAAEVREDRRSTILFMPQYRQSRTLRLLHNVLDIVGDQPAHSLGWTGICDRVFYLCNDGTPRALTQLLNGRPPRMVRALTAATRFAAQPPLRYALRLALGAEEVV